MNRDQALGCIILFGGILGIIAYFFLTFLSPWTLLTIQVSAFIAVAAFLLVVAWIRHTLATTPPPTQLEDLGSHNPISIEPDTETKRTEQE